MRPWPRVGGHGEWAQRLKGAAQLGTLSTAAAGIANCHAFRSTHSFLLTTAGGRQEEEVQVDLPKPQVRGARVWAAAPLQRLHGPGHSLLHTPPPPHCCTPDPQSH